MFEHIIYGFTHLLDPVLILLIVASLVGGIAIGALPGFSPTMGVALLVPFTFTMTPVEGLTVLAGVYTGAVYGGSISAILLNIPGAPANMATLFDGYPMALKGEGRKALLVSAMASAHGGIISGIALLVFAPLLAIVALMLGPAEKFWVAIFGLVIISSLGTGKELIKGLISGCFGIWLGIVGISPMTGEPRFTFGVIELWGGINIIPALVGFFAFSQVIIYFEELMSNDGKKIIQVPRIKGQAIKLFKEIWHRYRNLTLFSGILGTIIGIIPGAGGQVGGIIAYDQAKRFSKNKNEFGKGHIEGIIAPETANNATVGGSLIPLLTLGIPGSPTAAVLLGGLLIHGLWPGPLLFSVNAEITYTFMAAFLLGQVTLFFVAVALLKYTSNLLSIKEYYLGPFIITLCLFGSFAVNNNFFDIYIMLILGIVGYLFLKIGLLPAPVVLGLILGPIAEENLLLGMRISLAKDGIWNYFFCRPISIGIIVVIIAVFTSTVLIEIKRKKTDRETSVSKIEGSMPIKGIFTLDTLLGLVVMLTSISIWFFYLKHLSREASLFAIVIMFVVFVLGCIQFFYALFMHSDRIKWIPWKVVIDISIACLTAVLLAKAVGFYTVIFFLILYIGIKMLVVTGKICFKQIIRMLLFSFGIIGIFYLLFNVLIYLPTPKGLLF